MQVEEELTAESRRAELERLKAAHAADAGLLFFPSYLLFVGFPLRFCPSPLFFKLFLPVFPDFL